MNVYWLEQGQVEVPPHDGWLGAGERARLEKLSFPKRRAEWRLGRWTVKQAVSRFLQRASDFRSLQQVEVEAAPSGAPEVRLAGQESELTVSLSHRSGQCLCAVTAGNVNLGCDLETIEPRSDVFVEEYFTSEEQALLAQAPADLQPQLVALFWSAKESALKALREGLRLSTRTLEVWTGYGEQCGEWRPLAVRTATVGIFQGWWYCGAGLVRTLVAHPAPRPPARLFDPVYRPSIRDWCVAERR